MSQTHAIEGDLTFETVPALYANMIQWIQAATGDLVFDLSAARRADSAGLALLVESLEIASASGKRLHLANLPQNLKELFRINGLNTLAAAAAE